ncbi:hypothetical protein D3C87_1736520 [compost metagenome]
MKRFQPRDDVVLIRFLPLIPDRFAVEIGFRNKACGVLSWIEANAFRIAVGIDHITMKGGANRRRVGEQIRVEIMNMPVGIGKHLAVVVQALPNRCGNIGAGMGQAENDGRCAFFNIEDAHLTPPASEECRRRSRTQERRSQ